MNTVAPKSQFSLRLILLLAWRNLWRNKRRTMITSFSIAVSFAFALIVQTLNDGAHASMIANAIKLGNGHISVQQKGYGTNPTNFKMIDRHERVLDEVMALGADGTVEARITLNVLASTAHNSVAASIESGHPMSDSRFKLFKDFLIEGAWLDSAFPSKIVIGSQMAKKLNVRLGQKVVFMSANESGTTIAQMGRVAGIFHSNIEDVDKFVVLSSIEFGQKFLLEEDVSISNPVTRISLVLNNPDQSRKLQRQLASRFASGDIEVLHWEQMMPELLQFIRVDDTAGYVFLGLILIMVVFGVANTLFMSVLERAREFALLHVVGLSKSNLIVTIIVETFFLGVFALSIGWMLGLAFHYYFATYGIDVSNATENSLQIADTIMDPVVYSKLTLYRAIQFSSVAFISTMIVGIYPAFRAGRVAPVRALQT